ncbi:MAG: S-layer homology domain-containing protein [Anaerovoracaceae bacterium]
MIRKKLMAGLLAAALIVPTAVTPVPISAADRFTDISDHWGRDIINEAASLGIVGGYPEGNFLPDNLMKREEFFKLITNVLTEVPDTSTTTLNFYDVDPIEWYVPTIKTIYAAGIATGNGYGSIGIGQMITREEAAKIVASIVSTDNLDTTKNASSAKDAAQISSWALPYINIMFQKGYMQGDTEGNFRPTTALTRAEAATLLLNVKKKESVIKGPGTAGTTTGTNTGTVTPPVTVTGNPVCGSGHTVADGAFTVGNGTKDSPYQIMTEAQLNHVRKHLGSGLYFQLANNITVSTDFAATASAAAGSSDWSGGNFEPIGDKTAPFIGNFDGNNYTISGLNIQGTVVGSSTAAPYAGLFGCISSDSVVEEVIIANASVKGSTNVGGITGYNLGTIKNCVSDSGSKVEGTTNTGGIAGTSEGNIKSSINKGEVKSAGTNIGGIAGYVNAAEDEALYSCVNKGSVSGKARVGGIVGCAAGSSKDISIEKCSNTGNVEAEDNYAGGIIGQTEGGSGEFEIRACYNSGEISGEGINGGITGISEGKAIIIRDCYNTGEINGGSSGGIVGSNESKIENCYNTGKIIADKDAGGITATQDSSKAVIDQCYNDGAVTSNDSAGGIAGINEGTISNCYNTAKIKAEESAGGIAGMNKEEIELCYNAGKISGDDNEGGLAGENAGTVKKCFWLEDTVKNAVGSKKSGATLTYTIQVTEEELAGQSKVSVGSSRDYVADYFNDENDETVWEYLYDTSESLSKQKGYVYPSLTDTERA